MRNRFIISESEKKRILGLHEQFAGSGEMGDPTISMMKPPTKTNTVTPTVTTKITSDNVLKSLNDLKSSDSKNATYYDQAIKWVTGYPTQVTTLLNGSYTADDIVKYLKSNLQTQPNVIELIKSVFNTLIPTLKLPTTPIVATQPSQPIKLGIENPKVKQIQELLNTKYQSGLVPDGKWGPKTATALKKVLDTKKGVTTQSNEIKPPTGGDVSGTVASQSTVA
jgi:hypothetical protein